MNELSLFNSLFNNVFDNGLPDFNYGSSIPKVDVKEDDKSYSLEMDLPGMSEKDVSIELDRNVLTISSVKDETKEETSDKKDGKSKWLIRERRAIHFSRRFTLPEDVDPEKVKATFKNGVLLLDMPRKNLPSPKKIAIDVK